MKIILLQDVKTLGKKGDVVEIFGPSIEPFTFTVPDIYDEEGNILEVANHPEMKASEIKVKPDFITFEVVDGDTYQKTEVSKKLAFVENNRPIASKKVGTFISIISDGKYEKAYPVIVIPAASLVEQGYTVKDIEGNVITKEEAEDYFVILDGQHRSIAFARINATGETRVIPNVRIKEKENVGEYLVDINRVGNWNTKDKITVAALVNKEDELSLIHI